MKNTATLGQIKKLLTLIENVPSDKVQEALGSPFLSEVLCGDLERVLLLDSWKLICLTANPEEIVVTKPHEVCTYFNSDLRKLGRYQIRVWKGSHGYFKGRGHVSDGGFSTGGPMLFEYYYSGPQQSSENSHPQTGGGEFDSGSHFFFRGYEWLKETKTVPKKGSFDVFTLRKVSDETR